MLPTLGRSRGLRGLSLASDRVALIQIKATPRDRRLSCHLPGILSWRWSMSAGELAYLILVLGATSAFSVVLAWQTWRCDKER